jgi:hypothetical protein
MPARLERDAHEEVRARDVAGAHDQGRDRRLDVPREPVPRVVGEQVERAERDEQERHDDRPERSGPWEHAIVAHAALHHRAGTTLDRDLLVWRRE